MPGKLIINFDQTPLAYICVSNHTFHKNGASSVPLAGKDEKKQITGTFTVSKSGYFLPMQLIYEGKTDDACQKMLLFLVNLISYTPRIIGATKKKLYSI